MNKPFAKLRGRITEKFGSMRNFGRALNASAVTISAKLSRRTEFTLNDIAKWCNALDINTDDIGCYFFED